LTILINKKEFQMESYDTGKLKEIVSRRISLFQRKPEAAMYKPKVSSKHIYGLCTETSVRDHTVTSDYAEPAGGTNKASNPIELLLAAFAACIEASFYEFAVHRGIKINSLTVEVEGTLDLKGLFMVDESTKPGFQDLTYTFNIESPDNEDEIRQLAEKVIAHCPVVDSLINPVAVNGSINITT
jgi:uncharacterized OsmC-like protein